MKKKIYLPLIAVTAGIASALLAFQSHSLFYILVPVWALALGYFSGWRWGLLYGFLLFSGYTVTMSFIHNPPTSSIGLRFTLPFDIGFNFVLGGFSLVLIAGLASVIREKGVKHIASVLVMVVVALTVGYCSYTALPEYSHTYSAEILSEDMRHVDEIYLPVPAVNDEPYTEILEHQVLPSAGSPSDLVETEAGLMLRVSPSSLTAGRHLSISFRQEVDSFQAVQLMPKYESGTKIIGGKEEEVFAAPLRFVTSDEAELSLVVSASVITETQINFYNFKLTYFSDSLEFEGTVSGDERVIVEGQTGNIFKTRVTGASGY
jgi:hypothetical protein